MKTLILLILLLASGFAFWKLNQTSNLSFLSAPEQSRPAGSISHTVTKGETLHSIARQHRTTVRSLKDLNRLKDSTIFVNDALTVMPGTKSSQTRAVHNESNQPKVKSPVKENATPTAAAKVQPKSSPPKALVVAAPPEQKPKQKKQPVTRRNLPEHTVMESSEIAIDINAQNQVYLKNANGKFAPAGSIIYGSDADANGNEVKTITYRDLQGKETTLPGAAAPESVIRLALKKK